MSALTYNMKHFDQTTMFDSFMNSQDPLMENTNTIANNNISTSINHAEWLQDDIDIFKLYTKAHNNLSHVERILNLTWRLHTVRSRKLSNSNPPPSYTVENSFIFQQDISLSGQPSPFHDYTNSEYVPSQSGDPMDSNENNNNNNTNMFIDNDNLISKDNEFDMFLDEKFQSNHSMVTPMPMDIPQSVPTQNMLPHEHNNSFSNDHMSSSFVFNYMTPSSFTPSTSVNGFTPTTTSFIPTPVIPLTSTTTTNIFNDSTLLKNDNVSFSLPITNDMFKQKRSVGTTKKRSPSIAKSRTNSTSNNNNNNHNNNNTTTTTEHKPQGNLLQPLPIVTGNENDPNWTAPVLHPSTLQQRYGIPTTAATTGAAIPPIPPTSDEIGGVMGDNGIMMQSQLPISINQSIPQQQQSLQQQQQNTSNGGINMVRSNPYIKKESISSVSSGHSRQSMEDKEENTPGTPAWKRARLLERNRVAASKCRQRKKIAQLQLQKDFDNLSRENMIIKKKLNYYEKLISKFKKFTESHFQKCHASDDFKDLKMIEEMLMIDQDVFEVNENGTVLKMAENSYM